MQIQDSIDVGVDRLDGPMYFGAPGSHEPDWSHCEDVMGFKLEELSGQ